MQNYTTFRVEKKNVLLVTLLIAAAQMFAQKSSSDFVFTVNTSNAGTSATNAYEIFVDNSLMHNFDVDWNDDGVFDTLGVRATINHVYPTAGMKTIRIRGQFPVLKFGDKLSFWQNRALNDKDKLISIDQWGAQTWLDLRYAFSGCSNLTSVASDTIDLSLVGSLEGMFKEATSFNSNIDHWDVSSITNFSYLFEKAYAYNSPLNSWDVSSATNMTSMFNGGNLGPQTSSFNQPLNNWDVSSVIGMGDMFHSAVNFNQPLDSWDVSSVKYMSWMFVNALKFNQPLNNWDVSSVVNFTWMFGFARDFNQPLNNWQLDSAVQLHNMFTGCRDFNQPLDNWNTSNVTGMTYMFQFTDSFDQPLDKWDYSNVGIMIGFLSNSAYSYQNYDSLLMHLNSNHPNLNLTVGADGVEYCAGANARAQLISNGWIFNGDILRRGCQITGIAENESLQPINFYPNPASNQINVELDQDYSGKPYQLYSQTGQLLIDDLISQANFSIDLSELSNGVYFIRIGDASERLVIQR